jgi:hypothetical protein
MGRLTPGARLGGAMAQLPQQAAWELRRFAAVVSRRAGAAAWLLAGCVIVGAGAWTIERQQQRLRADTRLLSTPPGGTDAARPSLMVDDGRHRLAAFERLLFEHADIPIVVRSLLDLAEQEQLSVVRGDYRADPDTAGQFMRYRMSVPVNGEAAKIHRYLMAALRAHPTLALESVQFKRQRIESGEVEARIQWVLFTRLAAHRAPAGPVPVATGRTSGAQP